MSAETLLGMLQAEGLAPADCAPPSDAVRLSRAKRAARDTPETLEAAPALNVSGVSGVSGEKHQSSGEHEAQRMKTGHGLAVAAGDMFARMNADQRLREAAEAEGLDSVQVLALDDADAGELVLLSDAGLRAYALALIGTDERMAGRVPSGWTQASECDGCGPVWLWPGVDRVRACPWCWNRKHGWPVPRPGGQCGSSRGVSHTGGRTRKTCVGSSYENDLTREGTA